MTIDNWLIRFKTSPFMEKVKKIFSASFNPLLLRRGHCPLFIVHCQFLKAIPEFIKILAVKGVVFAFDSMNTQKKQLMPS